MSYIKNTWVNDETELSAQNFNYIENGIYENQNIEIIAISEDEPSTFNNGDKYYNTTDNKIYTVNDGEWDDGETPIRGALYILIDDQVTYYYDGKTLVSVGGGTEDILIQEEEPEEGKIWIDTAEVYNAGSLALEMYPIGSIYMTAMEAFNPEVAWGGTWVRWGAGRVPVGVDDTQTEFNTVEKTGGSKELQKHNHTVSVERMGGSPYYLENVAVTNTYVYMQNKTYTTSETGTGTSGNLQPYITCYMWKRTA